MKCFLPLYDKVLSWSTHQHAPRYLATLSFMEASVFPIPPDVMLIPMSVAQPAKALWYATLTTLSSVIGGLVGYGLGYFLFQSLVEPLIHQFGYTTYYEIVSRWFVQYGFWAILFAGITPIPYKLFTICSGMLQFNLGIFMLASIIGRGIRFYTVAVLMSLLGPKVAQFVREASSIWSWLIGSVAVLLLGFLWWAWKSWVGAG